MAERRIRIIIEGEDAGATRMLQSVGKEASGLSQSFASFGKSMQSVGTVAIGGAVAGTVALGGAMIATAADGAKMAMDLEAQMDVIASVLGKTEQEAQPLNDLILQLGINPNLKVSTLEAADAIETLATAGLSMGEIINGAAEATVLLSNASGGDFAQSAEIMTDSMAIFKDSISSYQDAVNGVIAVSNVSKFTVDDYALALAQAGGIAGTVGVEYDDFNTSIAAISSLFASGSDAGTSYKTMLQRLIPATNPAVDAMRDLGLFTGLTDKEFEKTQATIAKYKNQLADLDPKSKNFAKKSEELNEKINVLSATLQTGNNAFFDANGNLKDMADVSAILNKALANLSEEERNTALTTIFGTDAMRAAVGIAEAGAVVYTDAALAAKELGVSQEAVNAVIEGGITQFEALQLQMGKTDALEQAKQRVDNAKGVLEVFGGVAEAVKISIGQGFLPTIKELGLQFTNFLSDNSGSIIGFFRSFAEGLAFAASFIPPMLSGLASLGMQAGELVGEIASFATSIGGAIAPMYDFIAPVASAVTEFISWKDVMVALGVAVGSVVVPAVATLAATLWPIVASVGAVIAASALLRNAWESDFLGMRTTITDFSSAVSDLASSNDFSMLKTNVTTAMSDIGASVRDYFSGDISLGGLATAVSDGFADIGSAISAFFGGQDFGAFLSEIQWSDFVEKLSWENVVGTATLAWSDYISPLIWDGWVTAISWADWVVSLNWSEIITTTVDWATYISSLAWSDFVATMPDWSIYIPSLNWGGFMAMMIDWGTYISSLDWTGFVVQLLDWATWIPALIWNSFVAAIDWGAYLFTLDWKTVITELSSWNGYIALMQDWGAYISVLAWADWMMKMNWSDYVEEFTAWSNYVAALTWSNFVEKLNWPSIPWPGWGSFIPAFPGWPDIGAIIQDAIGSVTGLLPDTNAVGTNFWGGGVSLVGETGPELVYMPRGSKVVHSSETRALLTESGGGDTYIQIAANIAKEIDINSLAYEIADVLRRRNR